MRLTCHTAAQRANAEIAAITVPNRYAVDALTGCDRRPALARLCPRDRTSCGHFVGICRPRGQHAAPGNAKTPVFAGVFGDGRYWARTSDPQLVELVLSQ